MQVEILQVQYILLISSGASSLPQRLACIVEVCFYLPVVHPNPLSSDLRGPTALTRQTRAVDEPGLRTFSEERL